MEEAGRVLSKKNGMQLDHIGIAVRDIEEGVAYVEGLTGVEPTVHSPERGQPYQSGSLRISEDIFLEILTPNKEHKGVHPLKSILKSFDRPQLFFWYISTDNFEAFQSKVEQAGRKIIRKVVMEGVDREKHSEYTRGMIGPGFSSIVPNVIEWRHRSSLALTEQKCHVKGFSLQANNAKDLNEFFQRVGIDQVVSQGEPKLSLLLDTPNGEVLFENKAISLPSWKVMMLLLKDLLRV